MRSADESTIPGSRPKNSDERATALLQSRNLKMARSAHAYVRGSTAEFYEWLASADGRVVAAGPSIWICGDCHVGNLGPVANADGKIAIQICDLDQTVIGNPAHDLIRLGLSLATAARGSDLPGVTTARMLEQMVEARRSRAVSAFVAMSACGMSALTVIAGHRKESSASDLLRVECAGGVLA